MLTRYHITLGAQTTVGGVVQTASTTSTIDGLAVAVEGDLIDCPSCGIQGAIQTVQPRLIDTFDGKQVALSDDLCICRCNPPPKLVANQHLECQTFTLADVEAAAQAAERAGGQRMAASQVPRETHDERPRLVASSIDGIPYFIETADGRIFSGRTGADGLLPRVATQEAAEYVVYWGDEALARANAGREHA
jgi:uncharacterized Zn-binding protein involved in type VI secretion